MTSRTGEGEIDRMAIAEQVIVSAGEILRAAGFDRQEIASFLHQAADQLSGEPRAAGTQPPTSSPTAAPSGQMAPLLAEFSTIPPVRELLRLQAGDAAMQPPPTDAGALDRQYDLAMEIVPHLGAAQEWLRSMADEAGLPVRASRDEAASGEALFLEDFEAIYGPSFELIAAVLGDQFEQGREAAFRPLLLSLVNNNVTVTSTLKRSMERWIAQLG